MKTFQPMITKMHKMFGLNSNVKQLKIIMTYTA